MLNAHLLQFGDVEAGTLAFLDGMFRRFGGDIRLGRWLVAATAAVRTMTLVTGHAGYSKIRLARVVRFWKSSGNETAAKPEETASSIPEVHRITLPLLVLAAVTFFAGLGRGAITDSDEAFYADSAREMVVSGDWVTPYYNYEPRFQKPVLYYWLTAAASLVLGDSEMAARLWAAMAGLGLVLVTAAAGRRWYDESTGLLAGAIVATNFGYFSIGRMALPDLPLAFCITLAIWAALVATLEQERSPRKFVVLAALALGLGFLTKGPVGLIIPVIVIVPVLMIERRSIALTPSDLLLGFVVMIAVAVPWYVVMWFRHGNEYLQGFFIGDNFDRFATDRFNDPRPWWFYFPIVAGGLLPWTPLALVWMGPLTQWVRRRRDLSTIDLRLLLWAALPLAFYSLSVGKQPRYILPVLPPLALLLASSIVERTQEWRGFDGARSRPRRATGIVVGSLLSGAFFVALGGLLYRVQPLLINVAPIFTQVAAGIIAASGLLIGLFAISSHWRTAPVVIALAAAVSLPALQYGGWSSGGDDTIRQMARLVQQQRTAHEAVGTYQVFVRNLVFYAHTRTTDIITDEQAAQFLAQAGRALMVAPADVVDRLERERGLTLVRIAELPYFNEAGVRVRTLLWPDAARDLTRVVLVANR
ncbi:MAG: glycosyltransferase family 39 protein [Acidobacteria bacterium]|nr:glycosyltransferase family 39 protein [Acidobacteriota bacterium]